MVKADPAGNMKPDKQSARFKIDGVVAWIMALGRATRQAARFKSVYEERGLRAL